MWKNNIDRKIYLLFAWRVNECKNGQRKTNCVQNKENYLIDQVENYKKKNRIVLEILIQKCVSHLNSFRDLPTSLVLKCSQKSEK